MLERPCPIVDPMATEPAVAAIWAIMPGPCWAGAWTAGGGGAAYVWGGAAIVEAWRVCWGAGAGAGRAAGRDERDWRYEGERLSVKRAHRQERRRELTGMMIRESK